MKLYRVFLNGALFSTITLAIGFFKGLAGELGFVLGLLVVAGIYIVFVKETP